MFRSIPVVSDAAMSVLPAHVTSQNYTNHENHDGLVV